jgi:NAD(P)-dependent dehydrogenase (short-subunit alcohol dehydrogenase family)
MSHELLNGNNISTPEVCEKLPLQGKIALITGSSRDIGAGIAIELTRNGVSVIGNHRDGGKTKRADIVKKIIHEFGGDIEFVLSDITDPQERNNIYSAFQARYGDKGNLDFLILNASGPTREVNVVANNALIDLFLPNMSPGGKIILMQSVPGHFYDQLEDKNIIPDFYRPVAAAKNEGEKSIRTRIPELQKRGISLIVVCPPVVPDTSNMKLFTRKNNLTAEKHGQLSDKLELPHSVTIDQVATKITDLLQKNLDSGYIELFKNTE